MGSRHRTIDAFKAISDADGPVARLVVLEGPGRGRKYTISSEAVIGRSSTCDVIIDDGEVSRRHVKVRAVRGGFELEDLGSRNGTNVNGVPIESTSIQVGDKIQLAEHVVLVLAKYDPTSHEILQRQRLETLGRLSAGLAHDFNNMQAVITAGIDYVMTMTSRGEADAKVQATLRDMLQASDRASALARSLMSYARSDVDGFVTVNVAAICKEVLSFTSRTFTKLIEVQADVGPDLHVIASGAEIHQLLMNLCVNARDAMPQGGELLIRAHRVRTAELTGIDKPDGEHVVLLEVSDDGAGMDDETKARIFEPFFTTKSGSGFGLGLATVKEIVSSHGATMSLESEVGQGTTFRVALPAAAPPKTRRAESLPPPSEAAALPRLPPNTTVLVADDQAIVRRTMRRILEQSGATVLEASDGAEAVSLYAGNRRPDLVILDLDMPKATGEMAVTQLKQLDPNVRVLVMSGHQEDERERAARAMGILGFMHKPFNAIHLVTTALVALHDELDIASDDEMTTLKGRKTPQRG